MLTLNLLTPKPAIVDLNGLTIPQIKQWAKENNFNVPSGLKKADLIQYLIGAQQERADGINTVKQTSVALLETLQPLCADGNLDWVVHLHTHGWATVPINGWNPNYTQQFLHWFETCSPNFRANDPSTWKTANMPTMLHGILKHYFGHTEMQWQIRELCAPIFARIWGCQPEDLLCSYDGGCFLPRRVTKQTGSFKQWIHNDTPRQFRHFSCVQGIVNFEENGATDGGLVLVEGSHRIFNEYMDRHPSEGITWQPADMSDPGLVNSRLVKICAPAGHIILFDGRTFHCNVHPYGEGNPFRMCTYVSMQPRNGASEKELLKRQKLYQEGRMTGHWCYGPWLKETAKDPRTYGGVNIRPETIEIAPLTPLRSRLIGYD